MKKQNDKVIGLIIGIISLFFCIGIYWASVQYGFSINEKSSKLSNQSILKMSYGDTVVAYDTDYFDGYYGLRRIQHENRIIYCGDKSKTLKTYQTITTNGQDLMNVYNTSRMK